MKLFPFAAVALLVGCSTVSGLETKEPVVMESAKAADTVAACIAAGWAAQVADTRVLPIEGGQRVMSGHSAWNQTYQVADIRASGDGAVVEFRGISLPGLNWPRDTIDACI